MEGDFNTIGGLFFYQMDEVPKTGDTLVFQGYKLEITSMEINRIIKLKCIKV